MSNIAISVEEVSKMYRLGQVGTGTLSHDMKRWWHKAMGKGDPYQLVGEENRRDTKGGQYVWAVQDITFDVLEGKVLGIIGKNGAGKSTLLKLLSRVTAPTKGLIKARGRIASLLEVGTGFHPELTGRENIFLNGAILGMTRPEIRRKFDEIVDFAGIERYLDTPVKRYSSGMYVRLAFAVAAFLDPEILIVDEVLAVGDAEFQKKCLGRMKDVSRSEGRTVLFVSHNMGAIKNLCEETMMMQYGRTVYKGETATAIEKYLSSDADMDRYVHWEGDKRPGDSTVRLNSIRVNDKDGKIDRGLTTDDDVFVEVAYEVFKTTKDLRIEASLFGYDGENIFSSSDFYYHGEERVKEVGAYTSTMKIPKKMLNMSRYYISVNVGIPNVKAIITNLTLAFSIEALIYNELGIIASSKPPGHLHPVLDWKVEKH